MASCPSCGFEYEGGFKFCPDCGAPLAAPARRAAEERKVVTALFCDLVGFTATAESADPEDVNAMLAAYYAMARSQIESHGGVVEKFIGDAVVGVFGVPRAHEDDPERAVRAGLRIVEGAEELTAVGDAPLRLRVGINTGEALVKLGVAPGAGEGFLAGDAINTASRLQSAAPEQGVAVGQATYEATQPIFEYEELEPVTLKGKAEPARVFVPTAPRARFGADLLRTHDAPFIGREIDLALLQGVFAKALAATSVQLVTVVGEPGIGKSRIVAELGRHIDERPELITWRQGRCLPYGEGITFWALGEVLKAHAGILESDDPTTANAKLEIVLPEGPEREWFRQRLLPLLGIEATSTAERDELFTAWRRFLEQVAERYPTVLVFEDLHWADPAMLAFLEHLADRAEGVPLVIVGTARPELFERHPDYARGLRNATPITLAPLSAEETARLVSSLLEASVIPAELQAPILERSGGNPLYAEEFVRLLKDKELLVRKGSSWELTPGAEIPFPDSVQALIAARLDTLTPERKTMLADAAVVGKVFWAGAVAAMGDLPEEEVIDAMRELSRKELVRPARRSSMEGETEYAFAHVLARDVAYAQLPRSSRASRHVAAAAWIESKAPDRLEDLSDVLAFHYASALEFARAAGQLEQADELESKALRFLTLAGERALGLDTAAAMDAFERALALTPPGHPERSRVLAQFGRAALDSARFTDARAALEEALNAFIERGDHAGAAGALMFLSGVYESLNDPRLEDVARQALGLLEPLPPGPELVEVIAMNAMDAIVHGDAARGLAFADRAVALAEELGIPPSARALGNRAMARCSLGDPRGLQDFRDAVRVTTAMGQGRGVAVLYNNAGFTALGFAGPQVSLEFLREGRPFAQARGLRDIVLAIEVSEMAAIAYAGAFEEALALAGPLTERAEAMGDAFDLMGIRCAQMYALSLSGRPEEVTGLFEPMLASGEATARTDMLVLVESTVAIARAALGEPEGAKALLERLVAEPEIGELFELAVNIGPLVRIALSIGEVGLAERLVALLTARWPCGEHAGVTARAALAEARGDMAAAADGYEDAASRWETFGMAPEQGFAFLGLGRCLLELGRAGEATESLRRAREVFARCGMRPALEETDEALAKATALSS